MQKHDKKKPRRGKKGSMIKEESTFKLSSRTETHFGDEIDPKPTTWV